ncbi:Two-pore ion channel [Emiliania huxleyi CCMP1516]|uniref:Ion transport domain-containing protein n=2 Tax=Emiliania huxleyi TaxID=2903 RepID=A0A0D3I935_EMIH1|nr:Two-pore ion channel [Emiliania huxleyi CCMP1516]EOD07770.1 Two-pore ion channel [Emiliania huxleyi CCMP1516]|eukprot:XP_005760199.1 Two-pore ion channel [Emiliania huxleyi CCMP1516]
MPTRSTSLLSASSGAAPADEATRIRLACAYIADASHGWRPECHGVDVRSLTAFELFHSRPVQALRYLNVLAYMAIALCETPGWCITAKGTLAAECAADSGSLEAHHTFGFTPLSPLAGGALEACCVLLFVLQLGLKARFMGRHRFARSAPAVLQLLLLTVAAADLAVWCSSVSWRRTPLSRPLRPLFIVFAHRKLLSTFYAVVRMLPAVLELLLLISGLLAFSALISFVLFGPWEPPLAAFASYGSSFYSSFLLLTTTNFPDVALRPYRSSRATVLYFVVFQLTLVFDTYPAAFDRIPLSSLLALLYRAYERHMKSEAAVLSANRRRALRAAFALLVHDWQSAGAVDALSAEALPLSRFAPLLARLRPDLSAWQIGVIFEALDARKRGFLDPAEFDAVLCALHVRFDAKVTLALDALVLLNVALITWEGSLAAPPATNASTPAFEPGSGEELAHAHYRTGPAAGGWGDGFRDAAPRRERASRAAECCPLRADGVRFTAPGRVTCVKLWAFSRGTLLSVVLRGWNLFDAALSASGIVLMLTVLAVRATARATLHFLWLLFIVLFFFAAVGLEVFGGKWFEGAVCLEGSSYSRLGYHALNFNDLPSALVTCWVLTNGNNFNVFMGAAYACAPHAAATAFFGSFYVAVFFLVTNLLTSFILQSVVTTAWTGAASELSAAPWQAEEADLSVAERFARACEERLSAEGSQDSVTVRSDQADGYAALVGAFGGAGAERPRGGAGCDVSRSACRSEAAAAQAQTVLRQYTSG